MQVFRVEHKSSSAGRRLIPEEGGDGRAWRGGYRRQGWSGRCTMMRVCTGGTVGPVELGAWRGLELVQWQAVSCAVPHAV